MSFLDKILGALLVVALLIGGAAIIYAQHERGKVADVQHKLDDAQLAARQAAADRDAALEAAQAAQKQAKASEDAMNLAQTAHAANGQDVQAAQVIIQKQTEPVMKQTVPSSVWDAIFKRTK